MAKKPTTVDPREIAKQWYEANAVKNKATTEERSAAKKLENALKEYDGVYEVAVTNETKLLIGEMTKEEFVIDPKKLLELYPDDFWNLVSIPITNAKAVIGDKGVTKCSVPSKTTKFTIKKEKVSTDD